MCMQDEVLSARIIGEIDQVELRITLLEADHSFYLSRDWFGNDKIYSQLLKVKAMLRAEFEHLAALREMLSRV